MLQLNLSLIEEVDLCLKSGQIDDSLAICLRQMTGIRCLTDRGGDYMPKHIVAEHPLQKLVISRHFNTNIEPLSKLLEARWTS